MATVSKSMAGIVKTLAINLKDGQPLEKMVTVRFFLLLSEQQQQPALT